LTEWLVENNLTIQDLENEEILNEAPKWLKRAARAGALGTALAGGALGSMMPGHVPEKQHSPYAYSIGAGGGELMGDEKARANYEKELAAAERGEFSSGYVTQSPKWVHGVTEILSTNLDSDITADVIQTKNTEEGVITVVTLKGTVMAENPEHAQKLIEQQIRGHMQRMGMQVLGIESMGGPAGLGAEISPGTAYQYSQSMGEATQRVPVNLKLTVLEPRR